VAGREERERDEQRRPGADVVDHAPGERAADDAYPEQDRDHRARGLEPDPPHVVQVDHEERDHDPVAERVCDAAGLQQPDRSRKLRLQAFKIGGDGFQRGKRVLPNRETCLGALTCCRVAPGLQPPPRPVGMRSKRNAREEHVMKKLAIIGMVFAGLMLSSAGAWAQPTGMTKAEYRALMLRSEGLNQRYGLGQYSQQAINNKLGEIGAWAVSSPQQTNKYSQQAINNKLGEIGAWAVSSPQQTNKYSHQDINTNL